MKTKKILFRVIFYAVSITFLASDRAALAQGKKVEKTTPQQPHNEIDVRIRDELTELYQYDTPPKYMAAINHLNDAEKASVGKKYLLCLLDSAMQDEVDKRATIHPTEYWGMISINSARALREKIAIELSKSDDQNHNVEIWEWFLFHEEVNRIQSRAVKSCLNANPDAVRPILKRVITDLHPNFSVLSQCLKDRNAVGLDLDVGHVAALCQHHVSEVRENARQLLQAMGGPEPPDFDPAAALKSTAIRQIMTDLQDLFGDKYVGGPSKLISVGRKEKPNRGKFKTVGLLLEESNEGFEVINFYGRKKVTKKSENGVRHNPTRLELEDFVEQIAAIRAAGNEEFQLSEKGSFSGQFEGRAGETFEFAVAHWLYRHNELELSAKILLPAIESLARDSSVTEIVKSRMGINLGYEMVIAFVGERDHKTTSLLAQKIVNEHSTSPFHETAKTLLKELPLRKDDFEAFSLPTVDEWKAIKGKSSRQYQIDYLCSRFRLLNCWQTGQPGNVDWNSTQFREPQGLGYLAAWCENRGGTTLLNPFTELMMVVEPGDIPFLAQHLRKDWLCHSVYFWRDFHRQRQLHSTRTLVIEAINKAAEKEVVDELSLLKLDAAQLEKEIERISRLR